MDESTREVMDGINQLPDEKVFLVYRHLRRRFPSAAPRPCRSYRALIETPTFVSVTGGEYETVMSDLFKSLGIKRPKRRRSGMEKFPLIATEAILEMAFAVCDIAGNDPDQACEFEEALYQQLHSLAHLRIDEESPLTKSISGFQLPAPFDEFMILYRPDGSSPFVAGFTRYL